ncbi:thioredoxin I [Cordyceps militaris]|uniref:Thioredoxin I n=1 Tax=Cordyceps militaris TaxID=73501 RepID=A0A2H4SEH9_CORMI|nr:thioredoxin I [Cordyceps militaris]
MAAPPPQQVASLAQLEQVFAANTYVVVDFFATWCPPCKAIAPEYEKLAKGHGIPGHFAFVKVNVEEAADAAQKYKVTAMPTFLFFKDGKQVMVHGQLQILGGDGKARTALTAAATKIGGLAAARKAEAEEAAT